MKYVIELLVDWLFKAMRGALLLLLVGCASGQKLQGERIDRVVNTVTISEPVNVVPPAKVEPQTDAVTEFLNSFDVDPAQEHGTGFVKNVKADERHSTSKLSKEHFTSIEDSTLALCNADSECSSMELCSMFVDKYKIGACAQGCRSNAQCMSGYVCDGYMPAFNGSYAFPEKFGVCIKSH